MKNRISTIPGTPARVRGAPYRRTPEDKVDFSTGDMEDVIPVLIRIEVGGGRTSSASARRAARVQKTLEDVGGAAETVHLGGEHATLEAEADREQVLHVARLPFVRRISRS